MICRVENVAFVVNLSTTLMRDSAGSVVRVFIGAGAVVGVLVNMNVRNVKIGMIIELPTGKVE